MRIVLDLQACQTDSHKRGIGRYSCALAKAMARQRGEDELRFALNNIFAARAETVREEFSGLVAPGMFSYYQYPRFDKTLDFAHNYQRPVAGALVRNHYACLQPDLLHISSVFEGWYAQSAVPGRLSDLPGVIISATLYDIIPLLFPDWYMPTGPLKHFYHQKYRLLQECDLLLAISEASRKDAINYLGIAPEKIVTIAGAAEDRFRPLPISADEAQTLLRRYGLQKPFILYTGGLDYRKNLTGVISAFAMLPPEIRQTWQFAIVCDIDPVNEMILLRHAAKEGLADREIVFTGFVPEEDLIRLYNLCTLFIFPSLYEGFGLPVLEAMCCGAPVLGANNSSIAELIGREDALFDAGNPPLIAQALYYGLTDEDYRNDLRTWSHSRAREFTWDKTAAKALAAFAEARERGRPRDISQTVRYVPRRTMAFIAPLPDPEGGMGGLKTEMLLNLARYYDLDLFVDAPAKISAYVASNFRVFSLQDISARRENYEVVMYELGKDPCYAGIYDLLQRHPGIVVLRDFFLGELVQHIAYTNQGKGELLRVEMEYSHGSGLRRLFEQPAGANRAVAEYPCNRRVLDGATGIIVHTAAVRAWVQKFYPYGIAAPLTFIDPEQHPGQLAAEYALAIEMSTRQYVARHPSMLAAELGETLAPFAVPEHELASIAECILANRPKFRPVRILIDVTHTTCVDHRGGIQRVVRNLTEQLCHKKAPAWQAVPVRLMNGEIYENEAIIGFTPAAIAEKQEFGPEWHDIMLMLDAPWGHYNDFREIFPRIRARQGRIYVVIYDLLCVLCPQFFTADVPAMFDNWLAAAVLDSDGCICISRTVADELIHYIQARKLPYRKNLHIGYFHLGADVQVKPSEAAVRPAVEAWFAGKTTNVFLMVGTITQRKGHDFALDVFEKLWAAGADVKLAVAGKNWYYDEFIARMVEHGEYGRRLFWLDNPTDAEIDYCYSCAAALLYPSAAEGFGLPLVEAAAHGLPVICSDIPVFREVAREFATYFSLDDPQQLADILSTWSGRPAHPDAGRMPRLSWAQSAEQVIDMIIYDKWYKILP